MKAKQFYKVFHEVASTKDLQGFKRVDVTTYLCGDIEVALQLDKWGWSEEEGGNFRFNIRRRADVSYYNVTLYTLIKKKIVGRATVKGHYTHYPVIDANDRQYDWLMYQNEEDLRLLLDIIIEPVFEYALRYSKANGGLLDRILRRP